MLKGVIKKKGKLGYKCIILGKDIPYLLKKKI